MAEHNPTATLMRVIRCGYQTAKEILAGDRPMTVHQWDLVKEYNRDAGLDYQIIIPTNIPASMAEPDEITTCERKGCWSPTTWAVSRLDWTMVDGKVREDRYCGKHLATGIRSTRISDDEVVKVREI